MMKMKIRGMPYVCRSISWGKLVTKEMKAAGRSLTTSAAAAVTEEEEGGESLFSRLLLIGDPKISIVPVLDQWIQEERAIELQELRKIIRQFRQFRRVKHALQVNFH